MFGKVTIYIKFINLTNIFTGLQTLLFLFELIFNLAALFNASSFAEKSILPTDSIQQSPDSSHFNKQHLKPFFIDSLTKPFKDTVNLQTAFLDIDFERVRNHDAYTLGTTLQSFPGFFIPRTETWGGFETFLYNGLSSRYTDISLNHIPELNLNPKGYDLSLLSCQSWNSLAFHPSLTSGTYSLNLSTATPLPAQSATRIFWENAPFNNNVLFLNLLRPFHPNLALQFNFERIFFPSLYFEYPGQIQDSYNVFWYELWQGNPQDVINRGYAFLNSQTKYDIELLKKISLSKQLSFHYSLQESDREEQAIVGSQWDTTRVGYQDLRLDLRYNQFLPPNQSVEVILYLIQKKQNFNSLSGKQASLRPGFSVNHQLRWNFLKLESAINGFQDQLDYTGLPRFLRIDTTLSSIDTNYSSIDSSILTFDSLFNFDSLYTNRFDKRIVQLRGSTQLHFLWSEKWQSTVSGHLQYREDLSGIFFSWIGSNQWKPISHLFCLWTSRYTTLPPALSDLYLKDLYWGRHPSLTLDPEKILSNEFSVHYQFRKKIEVSLTNFWQRLSQKVEEKAINTSNNQFVISYQNRSNARLFISGINYHLTIRAIPWLRINIFGQKSLLYKWIEIPQNQKLWTTPFLQTLPPFPPSTLSSEIIFKHRLFPGRVDLENHIEIRYWAEHNQFDYLKKDYFKTPDYVLFDFKLVLQFNTFRLFYKINNLTNRSYSYFSIPPFDQQPGLTFTWGIQWNLADY